MRRDWEEALEIARELGDKKWQNRASGEIGFANFLDGDIGKAQQMVAATLITATLTGDVGAQIMYEFPKRLQYLAELQASLGKYEEADATYTRAADFIDAMVGKAPKVV